MKYQVLGHKRRLQKGDRPYDLICEFENIEQLYYKMDKVDPNIYDSVLVINTYTNELVVNRDLERPLVRNLHKK